MAGIYIHIPFCRQKCYYCDFYKTTNISLKAPFLSALEKELRKRKYFLTGEKIETIYLGGGTPSVLNEKELSKILGWIKNEFSVWADAEITLEANPDDLTPEYLQTIFNSGINRLSIGIQSFKNRHLKQMNRRHTANQANDSVEKAAKTGFKNISVDLIYGLPGLTSREWKQNLDELFRLPVNHLSAYHLTYHEGTPFYTWLKKGTLKELSENKSVIQFNTLIDKCLETGFEQYEISNFAKNKCWSKHNTAYWTGKKYLGLGPSAHSFNGKSRSWNIADVKIYCQALESGTSFSQHEILTESDKYNEYVLTHLRTQWGVSLETVQKKFGEEKAGFFKKEINKYVRRELVNEKNGVFSLTRDGCFLSDDIMSNLMII